LSARRERASLRRTLLSIGLYTQLALVLGVPLLLLVLWSVSDGWFPPGVFPQDYTGAHWRQALSDPLLGHALLSSMAIAVLVTVPSAVLAIPPAWVMSRMAPRTRHIFEWLILTPLIVPGIVIATTLGKLLLLAHLSYTWAGVVLAQLIGTLPLMIRILCASFMTLPDDAIAAARALGANAYQAIWHIALPLARKALFAGCLVVFASSLEEFDKTFVIGAPNVQTLPVLLYFRLDGAGIVFPVAAVSSLILTLPGLLIFIMAARAAGMAGQRPQDNGIDTVSHFDIGS
jgi:multiple sugar transport system permease protein/putative spermidine/putrescine transport system permease protein